MQFVGCLLFAALGIAQILAAYAAFEDWLGAFLAVVLLGTCVWFKLSIVVVLGAFFGAKNVWGWEWYWALAFAAPGLLLLVPAILGGLISGAKSLSDR
jgi:hypothetical protein